MVGNIKLEYDKDPSNIIRITGDLFKDPSSYDVVKFKYFYYTMELINKNVDNLQKLIGDAYEISIDLRFERIVLRISRK